MKSTKPTSEISIPAVDARSIANLIAVQTSDLLSAESAKACSAVLASLGLVPANATAIVATLNARVLELASVVRADLEHLSNDAYALQSERRASSQGLDGEGGQDLNEPGDADEDENVFEVDESIRLNQPLESFLRQAKDEVTSLNEGYRQLEQILRDLETER